MPGCSLPLSEPNNSLQRQGLHLWTDGETEAQREKVHCPRSSSQQVAESRDWSLLQSPSPRDPGEGPLSGLVSPPLQDGVLLVISKSRRNGCGKCFVNCKVLGKPERMKSYLGPVQAMCTPSPDSASPHLLHPFSLPSPGPQPYLEQPPTDSAQEDHGVVADCGHGYGGEARGSKHRRGLQGLQDGQWVLQVGSPTVQLLWLQLEEKQDVRTWL